MNTAQIVYASILYEDDRMIIIDMAAVSDPSFDVCRLRECGLFYNRRHGKVAKRFDLWRSDDQKPCDVYVDYEEKQFLQDHNKPNKDKLLLMKRMLDVGNKNIELKAFHTGFWDCMKI